jgi:hypothetical protein
VALLLADLGATKKHRRPHVSNGNPYPESQFRRPGSSSQSNAHQKLAKFLVRVFSRSFDTRRLATRLWICKQKDMSIQNRGEATAIPDKVAAQ